jgi:transposase
VLARDPRTWPIPLKQTRWTLSALQTGVPEFWQYSLSGIWRILAKLRLRWRRGRDHLRSPDPSYQAKVAQVAVRRAEVEANPDAAVLLYLDEVTYYRQPSLASAFSAAGGDGPRAERSLKSNVTTRIVAALNAHTGQVTAIQARQIGVVELVRFYRQLTETYPGKQLFVVQDNWPVHTHPDVLAALEEQTSPFPFYRPSSWPTEPTPQAKRLTLPIQLVMLPTYAPWTNPIEKLWRWLKQDVLHLHRHADNLPALRALVLDFLHTFEYGSHDLLRYVGLHYLTK